MNEIFHEDCLEVMARGIQYDYAFLGPPEYDELGWEPVKEDHLYFGWLAKVLSSLNPRKNVATIVISDRRHGGRVIPKHSKIIEMMMGMGWEYLSQKIWEKSPKVSLYRMNYSLVMSFGRGKFRSKNVKCFLNDVWPHHHKSIKLMGKCFSYNMPKEVVSKCLLNYTDKGDVVFDPFMGSGTTALACIDLGRNYLGSEIDKETHSLCLRRLGKKAQKKGVEDAPCAL